MDIVQKAEDTINSCSNMAQLVVACEWLQLAFRQMTLEEANDAVLLLESRADYLRKREVVLQPVVKEGEV